MTSTNPGGFAIQGVELAVVVPAYWLCAVVFKIKNIVMCFEFCCKICKWKVCAILVCFNWPYNAQFQQ